MGTYLTAHSVDEAVAAMTGGARPVAGGTDLVVAARQGKTPLPDDLVGIHRIPALGTIEERDDRLTIGALVTHGTIVASPSIRTTFTALADASAVVGSHATRANGTIGGNIMNASPAMDTGAPLVCFEALVSLCGAGGIREIPIGELWTGPGSTSAGSDELLTWVTMPLPAPGTGSAYVRLQYRRQMDIAVVGTAAVVTVEDGTITKARLALSAVAPTILRVTDAESALMGTPADHGAIEEAAASAAESALPIDDVRAPASYRRAMVAVMTQRAIKAAITRASGGEVPVPASDSTFGS